MVAWLCHFEPVVSQNVMGKQQTSQSLHGLKPQRQEILAQAVPDDLSLSTRPNLLKGHLPNNGKHP